MNYKEIKNQIGVELRDSIMELNDSDNREHFESLGVDIFNESERYRALINAIETAIERAQLYDANKDKIEAFDDIVAAYENNTGLGEHDEDLTDFEAIVDSIDHAIQMVGHRENEEVQE